MSNSFNISVAPEIAAVSALVTAAAVIITDIHDVDLPAVDTMLANVETDVAIIDGNVDAIKLKTDATPQMVRGNYSKYILSTTSGAFVDFCDLTGSGILRYINVWLTNAADTIELKFTIDGITTTTISHTGDLLLQSVITFDQSAGTAAFDINNVPHDAAAMHNLFMEFDTSLLIQGRRSAGVNDVVDAVAAVSLDAF